MKYTIGLDYGTQSGRALLVEVETGRELASAVYSYSNGVIDERLPESDILLGPDWALQDPEDYLRVLKQTVPAVLREAGVDPEDVIGIGVDFTACTILPIDQEGTPLCMKPEYRRNPHAWVKLWKHHAAQAEANMLNELARARGESFLERYGGKISSEWFFPKVLQIIHEAPEIYRAADKIIEAADWIVLQLTGVEARNACTAGYKAIWSRQEGYPTQEFLKALHPDLEDIVQEKMSQEIYPAGSKAGYLTDYWAKELGLTTKTAVGVAIIDAHVSVPATTVTEPGKMVMVMGTSTCHMVLSDEERFVEGMGGVVADGIIPGYYGYELGQAAVGDIFEWFVTNCVPAAYETEAKARGMNIHQLLTEKAEKLAVGQSGLLALDWWNGNRSVLVDAELSGMIIGATLNTKPEEIYRTLIEATAFGTNKIIKACESQGVTIKELYACGGLPEKNRMLMQIYADVTGRKIKVARSAQTPALGSAMFAAVAAGKDAGGYDNIVDAAKRMAGLKDLTFSPNMDNHRVYAEIYGEYERLHDYFGRGENNVMKRLRQLRK